MQEYETVRADRVKPGDYVVNLGRVETNRGSWDSVRNITSEEGHSLYMQTDNILIHKRPKYETSRVGNWTFVHLGGEPLAQFRTPADAAWCVAHKCGSQ